MPTQLSAGCAAADRSLSSQASRSVARQLAEIRRTSVGGSHRVVTSQAQPGTELARTRRWHGLSAMMASPCERTGDAWMRWPSFLRTHRPGLVLCVYVFLLLVGSASSPLGHAAAMAPQPGDALLISWLVVFWLIWGVWRRGRISHWILIIFGSGFGCVNAAYHIAKHPVALILFIIYASQLTLLLSPALVRHTNPVSRGTSYDS
jgi:hypothetical protein